MLVLTIPMLILGFYYLGRFRFLIRASYVTVIYSIGVDVMARYLPPGVTDDILLNALYGGVILIAGLDFGWEMALYAFVTLFMWGLVADSVLEGPSVVRSALIVTDEPDKISKALLQRIPRRFCRSAVLRILRGSSTS